jgi:hypothetical protein
MKFRLLFASATTLLACGWVSPALADPCEGALPRKGATFSFAVGHVGDGGELCIGPAGQAERWIEVRLADFYAPEWHERGGADAKRRLERAVMGKLLACRAGRRSYDRVMAACLLAWHPLGDVLRRAGGTEGGRDRPR